MKIIIALLFIFTAMPSLAADTPRDELLNGPEIALPETGSLIDGPSAVDREGDKTMNGSAEMPVAETQANTPAEQKPMQIPTAGDVPVKAIEPQNPVMPDETAGQTQGNSGILPEQIEKLFDKVTGNKAAAEPEPSDEYMTFDGMNSETLSLDFRSVFYTPEQIDYLYSRISRLKGTGGKVDALVDKARDKFESTSEQLMDRVNGEEKDKVYEHKMYFLSSILYPSDKNWTVWINDRKIRKEENSIDPKILAVDENYVVLSFSAGKELAMYSPGYDTKLQRTELNSEGFDLTSPDGNIQASSETGTVRFRLKQNQSFSLFDLMISEGPEAGANAAAQNTANVKPVAGGATLNAQSANDINLLAPVATSPAQPVPGQLPVQQIQGNAPQPYAMPAPGTTPANATAPSNMPPAPAGFKPPSSTVPNIATPAVKTVK